MFSSFILYIKSALVSCIFLVINSLSASSTFSSVNFSTHASFTNVFISWMNCFFTPNKFLSFCLFPELFDILLLLLLAYWLSFLFFFLFHIPIFSLFLGPLLFIYILVVFSSIVNTYSFILFTFFSTCFDKLRTNQ